MSDLKEQLLTVLRDIMLSDFFTKEEKDEVLSLTVKGNKPIEELVELLKKYLVAKVATGLKETKR